MVKVAALFLILASLSHAQSFEVASVKPAPSDAAWGYRFLPGGRAVLTGFRLRDLILLGWRLEDFRVLGTKGWMDSERFNIEAKAEGNPDKEESRRMVQSLLADRFRLAFHRETRELPSYSLVAAKRGAHLAASRPNVCTPHDDVSSFPAKPDAPDCGITMHLRTNPTPLLVLEANGVTLAWTARVLEALLASQVIDATGLGGTYDFRLEYGDEGRAPGSEASAPSLSAALQEQLGLKLETRRGPVEVFVVDHAERPSAN